MVGTMNPVAMMSTCSAVPTGIAQGAAARPSAGRRPPGSRTPRPRSRRPRPAPTRRPGSPARSRWPRTPAPWRTAAGPGCQRSACSSAAFLNAQQGAGVAYRDHRSGDQHACAPVLAGLLGEADRPVDGVVQPLHEVDALGAEDPLGELGQLLGLGIERGEELRVTTSSASTGSSWSRTPATSLSAAMASTPASRVKPNDSVIVSTVAAIPAGLCEASSRTVGPVRATSSHPARRTWRSHAHQRRVELPLVAAEVGLA